MRVALKVTSVIRTCQKAIYYNAFYPFFFGGRQPTCRKEEQKSLQIYGFFGHRFLKERIFVKSRNKAQSILTYWRAFWHRVGGNPPFKNRFEWHLSPYSNDWAALVVRSFHLRFCVIRKTVNFMLPQVAFHFLPQVKKFHIDVCKFSCHPYKFVLTLAWSTNPSVFCVAKASSL